MKKFFNKYFWTILIVLAAIGLAGSAAYFSVTGLSKLFAGSAMQVIIMASFIEFAKLVTTGALHRYWSKTMWWMKCTLTAMVLAVMLITSMGIYGFLADAYATTSVQLEMMEGKIELIEKQQEQKRLQVSGIKETKDIKSIRIKNLFNIKLQQESRVDSLQARGWSSSAKRAEKAVKETDMQIKSIEIELDSIMAKSIRINEEIGVLDIDVLDLQHSDVATEIGPLKYISTVLNRPMENVINYFILILIFVFDPLAVLLIVFASNVYDANSEETLLKKEPKEAEGELEYQKVVDAINGVDDEVFDLSSNFPEEKGEEVIEYVEGEDGSFEKSEKPDDKLASLIKGIDSNPIYIKLLDVLFIDGQRVVGDTIPPYRSLVKDIADRGIVCEDKEIKNFLTICNLLDITNMSNKDDVKIVKNYSTAKGIVSLISK